MGHSLTRQFLSTPSARRATHSAHDCLKVSKRFLSTPSARRATHQRSDGQNPLFISIHALREEGDSSSSNEKMMPLLFLSTPSARRATHGSPPLPTPGGNFYPRPPRGGRHRTPATFYPHWGTISIHALREEGDNRNRPDWPIFSKFLSTPSARRATAKTEKNISAFVSL